MSLWLDGERGIDARLDPEDDALLLRAWQLCIGPLRSRKKRPLQYAHLVLDEVQDPHNLGAVIRSALGLGASGIILPKHRSVGVTPAVSKVAVGAETSLPVAQVTNLARFLEHAREAGFWVYGATASGSEALGQVEFAERTVLVLGSERRGIRPNVASRCDVEVAIPLGEIESLNVSVAAGILMWEWARQRRSETA